MSNPKKIGVTGGIGSGKSLVCKIFSNLGIPIYDSDSRAKWLMNNDEIIREKIIERFGTESFTADNELNRSFIAGKVFNNEENLGDLNKIVHPRVAVDFDQWSQENNEATFLIKEAALMFESGAHKALDMVINVSAPINIRIDRILKRDTFRSKKEVLAIVDKQMSEEERVQRSDQVIVNDDKTMVIPQVLKLYHQLSN